MTSPSDAHAYYRAALSALRFVEQRRPTGRRFGTEADARWAALRGDLATADRIDLLIRDANAEWPGALGARAVFSLNDVAEDDPFGAHWQPLDAVDGEELWKASSSDPVPPTLRAALDAVAEAWGMTLSSFDLETVSPSDRVIIAGPSAIASALTLFAESSDLDWRRQVSVIATAPGARQLAALAPAWLNVNQPVRVLAAEEPAAAVGKSRVVVSDDASDADRRWAHTLGQKV